MREQLSLRNFLVATGIICALVAYDLSQKEGYGEVQTSTLLQRREVPVGAGGGVDIAADGGALGFALLAGLCFVSAAIVHVGVGKGSA